MQFVRMKEETVNRAVHRATKEIELIREYRARLIADVVTGKLDVREAAAELAEEGDLYDAEEYAVTKEVTV